MSIIFEVIDLNCEQADHSFFVPQVTLTGKSSTTLATLYGYDEFGTPSSPPKKYRTITFSGTSDRTALTAEETPQQCAGAKYVYSGVGQVDFHGHQISNYSKKFYAQCAKQFWPLEGLQSNDRAITTGGAFPRFVGFCWAQIANSCPTCDPDDLNWPFIGEQAVNNPQVDLAGFMRLPSDPVITKTSWSINKVFVALTSIEMDTPYFATLFGTNADNYNVTVGVNNYTARALVTNPTPLDFPVVAIQDSSGTFVNGAYIVFTDTNSYSAVLSDEYTDADALANATIVQGTGTVAQNLPRTTGFTSITTSVVYNLKCINLIPGYNYIVTVDLWDQPANTHTPKTYSFQATSATQVITDIIPTPAAGHTIAVKSPVIAFALP